MARYGKEHKQETRRRILDTAGRRFKTDGIDGSGVATLMADAGLTNGAFYAHFSSKEDLVANVVADQLSAQADRFSELPPGRAGLEAFLREYLSPQHRDDPGAGCPAAALLDEIGRCPTGAKDAYTDGARVILVRSRAAWLRRIRSRRTGRRSRCTRWLSGRCSCPARCPTSVSPMRSSSRVSKTSSRSSPEARPLDVQEAVPRHGPLDIEGAVSPAVLLLEECEGSLDELPVELEDAAVSGVRVDHQVAVRQAPGQVERVLGRHHPVALAVGDEDGLADGREVGGPFQSPPVDR